MHFFFFTNSVLSIKYWFQAKPAKRKEVTRIAAKKNAIYFKNIAANMKIIFKKTSGVISKMAAIKKKVASRSFCSKCLQEEILCSLFQEISWRTSWRSSMLLLLLWRMQCPPRILPQPRRWSPRRLLVPSATRPSSRKRLLPSASDASECKNFLKNFLEKKEAAFGVFEKERNTFFDVLNLFDKKLKLAPPRKKPLLLILLRT